MKYLVSGITILFFLAVQTEAEELKKTNPEVISQCDVNGDGRINTGKEYRAGKISKEIAKKEFKCYLDLGMKKAEEDLKKAEEDLKKEEERGKKLDKDLKKLQYIKKILKHP